jgi:NAD(P)-dependent dehydrogenase (short-subunit alcohol dehydrogenase family)
MAKAADDQLAQAAAVQLKQHKVASVAVHLGWVRTEGVLLYADRLDMADSRLPRGPGASSPRWLTIPGLLSLSGRALSVAALAQCYGIDVSS